MENEIEKIQAEKQNFHRYLDGVANKLNHHWDKYEASFTDKSSIYRLLESVQNEGDWIVRKVSNKLETKLQDNQVDYRQQLKKLEET